MGSKPRSSRLSPGMPSAAGLSLVAAALVVPLVFVGAGCTPSSVSPVTPTISPLSKIAFSLDDINADGLIGGASALRSLDYEFCIPAEEATVQDVLAIDPTVRVMRASRGRIGCTADEFLCVNNTHAPGWRNTLLRLAALPYVRRIQQTFWE